MASHILDMVTMQNNFSTPEMRAVWDERNRLQKQLDVEGALALAEGELGVIPKEAARAIADAADADLFDLGEIAEIGKTAKHGLIPTLRILQRLVGEAGEFIHFGPTTQDIVDTGMVLQLREAHAILTRDLRRLIRALAEKAKEYERTVMAGRSHGTEAVPITFGFKLSVWLDAFARNLERLKESETRVFTGVLSGAVGTFASYGGKGSAVEARALERLGLAVPSVCWHAAPDRLAEYAGELALLSAALGSMANEFFNLMRTQYGEIEEPFTPGKVGSSTMPQKRNPATFETIASLSRPSLYAADLVRDGIFVDHGRDAVGWRGEWLGLSEIAQYLSLQLSLAVYVVEGLVVKPRVMRENLERSGGLISAENVMFRLGEYVGKQSAHSILYRIAMEAEETGRPFRELLQEAPEVAAHFSAEEIDALTAPETNIGECVDITRRVLENIAAKGLLADK